MNLIHCLPDRLRSPVNRATLVCDLRPPTVCWLPAHKTARHTFSQYAAVFAFNVSFSTKSQTHTTLDQHYQRSVSQHGLTHTNVAQLTQYTHTQDPQTISATAQCGNTADRFRHDRGSFVQFQIFSLTRPQNRVRSRGRPAKECATHMHAHSRTDSGTLTKRYVSLQANEQRRAGSEDQCAATRRWLLMCGAPDARNFSR